MGRWILLRFAIPSTNTDTDVDTKGSCVSRCKISALLRSIICEYPLDETSKMMLKTSVRVGPGIFIKNSIQWLWYFSSNDGQSFSSVNPGFTKKLCGPDYSCTGSPMTSKY